MLGWKDSDTYMAFGIPDQYCLDLPLQQPPKEVKAITITLQLPYLPRGAILPP